MRSRKHTNENISSKEIAILQPYVPFANTYSPALFCSSSNYKCWDARSLHLVMLHLHRGRISECLAIMINVEVERVLRRDRSTEQGCCEDEGRKAEWDGKKEGKSRVSNSRPGGEWARHASTKWDWILWPCRTTFGSRSARLSPLRSVRPIPPHLSTVAADLGGVEVPLPATPDPGLSHRLEKFGDLHLFPWARDFYILVRGAPRVIATVTTDDRKDSPAIRAHLDERNAR